MLLQLVRSQEVVVSLHHLLSDSARANLEKDHFSVHRLPRESSDCVGRRWIDGIFTTSVSVMTWWVKRFAMVLSFNQEKQTLMVLTKTGKRVAVYLYSIDGTRDEFRNSSDGRVTDV